MHMQKSALGEGSRDSGRVVGNLENYERLVVRCVASTV
jgi:hypothetical protein